MSQTTQTPQTDIPESVQSFNITTQIKIRHLFDADTYAKTLFHIEVCGEAVIDGRRIEFPCRVSERAFHLTYENPLKLIIEDILYEQNLVYTGIINFAKRRKELLEELQKYGQVEEEFAQDYDEEDDYEDSDP